MPYLAILRLLWLNFVHFDNSMVTVVRTSEAMKSMQYLRKANKLQEQFILCDIFVNIKLSPVHTVGKCLTHNLWEMANKLYSRWSMRASSYGLQICDINFVAVSTRLSYSSTSIFVRLGHRAAGAADVDRMTPCRNNFLDIGRTSLRLQQPRKSLRNLPARSLASEQLMP
jgi:hypothetical protein